jgi:hypothetical protein
VARLYDDPPGHAVELYSSNSRSRRKAAMQWTKAFPGVTRSSSQTHFHRKRSESCGLAHGRSGVIDPLGGIDHCAARNLRHTTDHGMAPDQGGGVLPRTGLDVSKEPRGLGRHPVDLHQGADRIHATLRVARKAHSTHPPASGGYLLASYCHAPILKRLSGSCSAFSARNRFMVSCGNTPSISVSLSGMALFKYVVT